MNYEINVLNPSLSVEGKLRNIKSVEIYEVINNQYVADVEITENIFPSFLHHSNLLEIDNDYFLIADIDKQRDSSKSINLSLEHISYKLNNPSLAPSVPLDEDGKEMEEFYEGSIEQVIQQLWGGMSQFTIQTNVGGYFYYRPKTSGGRSRIQEFARQNGLEVEYNKFTIFVHGRRGGNNGLEFRVGENVRSVSQKISVNDEFYIEYAHEVDIVDFSEMSGQYHSAIASANIGDTVRIIDTDLAIDATERIVAKRYSPLFKQVPQISVGQVVRDIVDIINEDEEDKDKEKDKAADYFLQSWQIGDVNCLELSNVELGEEDVLPDGISSTINYYIQGEKKKMSLAVKSQYSNYHVYIGEWYEDNTYIEYKLQDVVNVMATWEFPKPKMQAIGVTVSEVPLEEYDATVHKLRDYGVKFNKVHIDPLQQFKVGNKNIMATNALIDTGDENLELDDFSAKIEYNLMQEFTGVTLSLKREFSNFAVTVITMGSEGIPTVYDYSAIKEQLPTWKLPRVDAEYLLVTISEVPSDQFNPAVHKQVMYGVKFEQVPISPLYSCKIGPIECLNLSGFETAKDPALNEMQAEIFFEELDELEGLNITLKRDYRSYDIYVTTYDSKGTPTSHSYDDIKNWTFPKKSVMYIYIEVLQVPKEEFDASQHRRAQYAVFFTERNNEPLDKLGPSYYIESETIKASSSGAQFDFTVPYDDVVSVTLGIGENEQTEPIVAYWSLIKDATEMYTGVFVDVKGLTSGDIDVSVQAVVQEGIEIEGGEENG